MFNHGSYAVGFTDSKKTVFIVNLSFAFVLTLLYGKIYSSTIPLVYQENVLFVLLPSMVFLLLSKFSFRVFFTFIPFLLTIIIFEVYHNSDFSVFMKYFLYAIFSTLILFCLNVNVVKYFVRMYAFIIFLALLIYFGVLVFGPDLSYAVSKLDVPPSNSMMVRNDWDYSLQYYILIYPLNFVESGLLGVPRFFGISAEPTLLACIVVPLIHLSLILKCRLSFIIFLLSFLLASSFGSFIIVLLSLLVVYRFSIINAVILVFVLYFYEFIVTTVGESRYLLYSELFSNQYSFSFFGDNYNDNTVSHGYGLLSFVSEHGLFVLFGYCVSIYIYAKKMSFFNFNKIHAFFVLSAFVLFNKAGEPLSLAMIIYFTILMYFYGFESKITRAYPWITERGGSILLGHESKIESALRI